MAFKAKEARIIPQAIADISATQNLPLGTRVKATDPTYGEGEFIYLEGVANTIAGSAAIINSDDWSTTLTTANAIGQIGFAVGANVADYYGWYQIYGNAEVAVSADVADNASLYLTATAGKLDDTDVAGDFVVNCKAASANATGGASTIRAEISYPHTTNGADD